MDQTRTCVRCAKPLPGSSKMTEENVPHAEAQQNQWQGRPAAHDAVTVAMCLQCQIERAELRKNA